MIANWQISNIWSWCYCRRRPSFFGPQKILHQVIYQFNHFSYKLHGITVTYYIVEKKANNFSKTSVTIAVTTCNSLCVCVLSVFAFSISRPLRLRLLYLNKSSAPSTSSMACSVRICCLYFIRSIYICCASVSCLLRLHFPWLILSTSIVFAVCICYASMGHLLRLHLLWLAPSASAICTSFAPSTSAIPWWVIRSICVYCGSFCLHLLCLSELFTLFVIFIACSVCICYLCRLRLLFFGKLFAPSAFSATRSVCVCCLCLVCFVCVFNFIIFVVSCME